MGTIQQINIVDKSVKKILLFDKIENVKKINILFGGNGVGKTALLNAIRDGKVELVGENLDDTIIKSYTNSIDNAKINRRKELYSTNELVKAFNAKNFSEGQSIIHYVLSFLNEIKEIKSDKNIIVLMDEVDSGLSAENINTVLWLIKDILNTKENVQFFISSNNYHFTYVVKNVVNMYTGKYTYIETYEEYFKLLNKGMQIMKRSGKRDFKFLDIY